MTARRLGLLACFLALATLVSWYLLGLTGTLRVSICDEFSIHSPNPACRAAVYWGWLFYAFAVATVGPAIAAVVVGVRSRGKRVTPT